ncbi:MAG: gamma-glutamyltransferase [Gammaproteobacteria bacterium]|nr:gamma-glutamyltransferase [Gammaproteobacteria bacterium]MCY4210838.1 gamma-glutamyltransferase [Gammaproteobacteria bacterium]MCY4281910.1 gamma-glutamyltransferase [Gammaproteobacteria bacterium]MCY4339212.1 gamma-glutamyltransferase [Gammaproteobacteria bacterium]
MGVPRTRSPVSAGNGMVACSQPLAGQVGLDILKRGGSAVDAALATNAALALMEPHMCGPGGDLFAIVWDAKAQQLHGLNAAGRAPASLSYLELARRLRELGAQRIPDYHILSVSAPGAVHGWGALHEKFGRLPLADLLAPAIRYAQAGFPVSPVIAGEWQAAVAVPPAAVPAAAAASVPGGFRALYAPGGKAPAAGELFINKDLAHTYRLLAEGGVGAFYRGEPAQRIAGFMREHGGYLDHDDLAAQHSGWIAPVSVNYRGHEVCELPPQGQGVTVLQMLQMLKDDDLAGMGFMSAARLHLLLEVKKLVFEDRAKFYADPEFAELPLAGLLSARYNRQRRALVGDTAANKVRAGAQLLRHGDTSYLTTADSDGNMVSLIQSIYHFFGSGIVVPGTGFALQNRGLLFSMDPAHPNVYAPGKRPFHTIIPAFVMRDERPLLSFGVVGGDMQPQGQLQVLTNIIDFGMDVQQAGDAPRWRHDGSTMPTGDNDDHLSDGGTVLVEPGISDQVIKDLTQRGHRVQRDTCAFGGYQAIMRGTNGVYHGASESRHDGQAAGY